MTSTKLFRLTKQFVSEYSHSDEPVSESFYVSDDIEKVKCYVNGRFGIELDSNAKFSRYYRDEEGGDYYNLEEVEVISLL